MYFGLKSIKLIFKHNNIRNSLNINKSRSMADNNFPFSFLGFQCPCDQFFRVEGTLYNKNYIKTISCNDMECDVVMANTEHSINNASFKYNLDKTLTCEKMRRPECYRKLRGMVESID